MKLYIKTRDKFFKLSILILIVALVMIFLLNLITFGNFLLGIFASTIIITIQCDLSAEVEEGKLLINKLKQIRDVCFEFFDFNAFSVDFFAIEFESRFKECKQKLEYLFSLNDELGNITDMNKKTKKALDEIVKKISNLECDLYYIFENFDSQNTKMKIIYFMEFYKIMKKFNFDELKHMVSTLGWNIDSREFYRDDFKEKKKRKFKNLECDTPIQVYNKQLEVNNSIEYRALKNKFEKFIR